MPDTVIYTTVTRALLIRHSSIDGYDTSELVDIGPSTTIDFYAYFGGPSGGTQNVLYIAKMDGQSFPDWEWLPTGPPGSTLTDVRPWVSAFIAGDPQEPWPGGVTDYHPEPTLTPFLSFATKFGGTFGRLTLEDFGTTYPPPKTVCPAPAEVGLLGTAYAPDALSLEHFAPTGTHIIITGFGYQFMFSEPDTCGPLTQIDWSDPSNWYGEDVGSNFAGEATGTVDGTSTAIEFPEEPEGSTPEYTYEIVPADLRDAGIPSVRVEIEVASGSGEVSWAVHVATGGLPIIQRNNDEGTPTIGPGLHSYTLGPALDETDDGELVGAPWSLAAFLEQLAVDNPPATPRVTGSVTLQSGGPITISAFRLIAVCATARRMPPRRGIPRHQLTTAARGAGGRDSVQDGPRGVGAVV